MNSKFVSTAYRTLNSCPKLIRSPNRPTLDNISFASQTTGSRVSVGTPIGPARITAFYAPLEETAAPLEETAAQPEETAETLYELLGIPEDGSASASVIKRAYKQMARMYHPDVSPPDRVDEYTKRFIMVRETYEILSSPEARASYDRDLAVSFGGKSRQYQQEWEEKVEWKCRWLSRRDGNGMSWGAQMRSPT